MKFQILALGAFLCLGATAPAQTTPDQAASAQTTPAQTSNQDQKSTQSANRIKQNTGTQLSLTGCVDQQNGQYILHDAKNGQMLNLQAPGDADNYFARFVGHQVQASGMQSGSTLKIVQIGQVADMCGTGK